MGVGVGGSQVAANAQSRQRAVNVWSVGFVTPCARVVSRALVIVAPFGTGTDNGTISGVKPIKAFCRVHGLGLNVERGSSAVWVSCRVPLLCQDVQGDIMTERQLVLWLL